MKRCILQGVSRLYESSSRCSPASRPCVTLLLCAHSNEAAGNLFTLNACVWNQKDFQHKMQLNLICSLQPLQDVVFLCTYALHVRAARLRRTAAA